ncbi:Na+/H+ antiporter NhaA [Microbulbifer agarilyticus]|uniref:Na+/H+ antiporter NhaA n=1 Tax=Microbulbifer agarilyticus TaxID=260552 RepID=UPI001C980FB4|nr:Na+/H+ antiporter NhaA [Microbulbifer agarilyticus]MBY6190687.1 Na+/H+ antiporter NhaA [Microbulbifer agarilyticus]
MTAVRKFIEHESFGGILLVSAALIAMLLANSALQGFYFDGLNTTVAVIFGDFSIQKPLLLWVNDGLMALFFLLVGLEIKREVLEGHLSSKDQVILPGLAAVAGMAFPALIYTAINFDNPETMRGWAVPSATDIAFAIGVFTLFGKRLPVSLKLFLLSVAIFDDIGAILIIALFYSSDLSMVSLGVASAGFAALFMLNRARVTNLAPYVLIGIIIWIAVLKSGVHATLAGFLTAWFIPLRVNRAKPRVPLHRMEHGLLPWVTLLILPVFAFANAGVSLSGFSLERLLNPVTLGIALGLFFGNQVGIFSTAWLTVKSGLARLPAGANWLHVYGVALLCGVGFTMSLFIGTLAFEGYPPAYQENVKVGVLLGSFLSAFAGIAVLYYSCRKPAEEGLSRNEQRAGIFQASSAGKA